MARHRKEMTFGVWLRMFISWPVAPSKGESSYDVAMRQQADLEAKTILLQLLVSLESTERTTGKRPQGGAVTYNLWSKLPLVEERLNYHLEHDPEWQNLHIRYDSALSGISLFRFTHSQKV